MKALTLQRFNARIGTGDHTALENTIRSQTTVILVSLVFYKLLLIGIGLWASRRVQNADDFLLGGRNLGPWVAG